MNEYDFLLPYLQFLASSVGSGAFASWLFAQARKSFPKNKPKYRIIVAILRGVYLLLFSPRLARISAPVAAAFVSYGATMGLQYVFGMDGSGAMEALLAAIVSQVVYALGKPILPESTTQNKD